MRIGEYVRKYRLDHGMSAQELARKAGVSRAYIYQLGSGRNPSTKKPFVPAIETLLGLAKAMDTNLNSMLENACTLCFAVSHIA